MASRTLLYIDSDDGFTDEVDSAVDDFSIAGITLTTALGIDMGGFKITNLADPTQPQDGASKSYVDLIGAGFKFKDPVRVTSDTNESISGLPTIDGVGPLVDNDRVLLTGNTSAIENGIWEVHVGAWTRPTDYSIGSSATGAFVIVEAGSVFADTLWLCTTNAPNDIVDTDPTTWTQLNVSAFTAGDGIDIPHRRHCCPRQPVE